MNWRWWRRPRYEPRHGNGHAAAEAKDEASKRLAAEMRRRGDVVEARDRFAQLIEQALRGTR